MQLPTIHLNGTSKDRLIEDLREASGALSEAYEKLKLTAPNGRDYPQGHDALHRAQAEHMARIRKLNEIRNEVNALASAIDKIAQ